MDRDQGKSSGRKTLKTSQNDTRRKSAAASHGHKAATSKKVNWKRLSGEGCVTAFLPEKIVAGHR